jgi:hypothetical protein
MPLVTIQPKQEILPIGLTNPKHQIFQTATAGIELQEIALADDGNETLLDNAHAAIHLATRMTKQKLCGSYHYSAPEPGDKKRWDILCTSGKDGKWSRSMQLCRSCNFFNQENNPDARSTVK